MGKLVVTEFITLDGVFEDPGGASKFEHGGWSFKFNRGAEGDRFKYEELLAADAQLLGRITYQGFAKAWPAITDAGDFGEKMNSMPKYVVSTTLGDKDATWTNSKVIRDHIPAHVAQLKENVKGDILVAGSAQLVKTLAENNLVDEYRLMVYPIVLGSGKRFFGEGTPMRTLELVDTKQMGTDGVTLLTYRPTAG